MRLWHYQLIPVLPRQQLVSQWRELIAIHKKIAKDGTPNHSLVNKVLEYPIEHFKDYTLKVYLELRKRDYSPASELLDDVMKWDSKSFAVTPWNFLFENWHTKRYLKQCFHNLEEKHDCKLVTDIEWHKLETEYHRLTKNRENRLTYLENSFMKKSEG